MLNPGEIFKFKITTASKTSEISEVTDPDTEPVTETTYKTRWSLREDCPYLNGHFPNQPLLPAVATIDGSIEFLRQALANPTLNPQSVFNAKFMAPITPGIEIEMSLVQVVPSKWQIDWSTQSSTGEVQLLARVGLQV